ncbi:DNA-processing protein DprA [Streptomyces meridianus]|uniref:DNA-processing protein DprA n=1 Tax=Streptomyces meridianus TaxID=2938945 RepID=A0ABT0X3X6_9ACTN|nr:DNA-processing protein DprA [Streptomyces meridianus]MCM2576618.1 DNA-processing protein DprA [Streptomyces meridianus]
MSSEVVVPRSADTGERLTRAALTRIVEPGDELAGAMLRRMGPCELLHMFTGGRKPPPGMSAERLAGYRIRAERLAPEADLAAVEAIGGRFLCPGDREWPRQLEDLGDAQPIGLWVRGQPSLRMWALRSVAVVGARACTDYGAHMAAAFGSGLAESGWVVVSGAAFGVDGAAHRGALAAGGATVGVLACGVDSAYPRGHTELIARIADHGLLVAELPPGSHPTRSRFVLRNRLIAALTRGTLVVEAQYRSGSLATARCALRLGRYTMGVPGPVTSGLSAGVHELLRGEGVLVTDASEVIELIGSIGDLAPPRHGHVMPRDAVGPHRLRILDALPAHGAVETHQVARRAGASLRAAEEALCELQSLGFVERQGCTWKLVHPRGDVDPVARGGP